ncbi:hypothetical protein HW932_03910 [Allochromatium humboldtianum]|uniref:Uncharacterized protein n=1 Tax=Allochromatium humboldtianum TaxID=504901 RepID=A0A850RFG9_9GAMM|nr:hypothetical protein [Allochromatium humboldtianum]NVZ08401.1 hypothetical protein [Allochromatium humboldtianum]
MPITLAPKTRETLCKELGVSNLPDLMDRDFQDISPDTDVDRAKVALYADRNRGSVRLNSGRFYTAKEFADRVRKIKSLVLP